MKFRPFCVASLLVSSLFFGCSPAEEKQKKYSKEQIEQATDEQSILNDKQRLDRAKRIYSLLPTPLETSIILRDAGVNFNMALLNEPNDAYNYKTSLAQSLNIGVYGTDLSFCAAYGKEPEVVTYLGAIKKLSDDLHIANVFTEELMQKVEDNINDRDVLMKLISDSYWGANNSLSENERGSVATLIIAGGWLEALYLAVKITDKDYSKTEIVQKIGQQRHTLELLMELFNDSKDDPAVKTVLPDFEALMEIYASMDYTGESESYQDPISGEEKDGVLKTVNITKSDLNNITDKVINMRSIYVKLN